jgi:hypothetical protein
MLIYALLSPSAARCRELSPPRSFYMPLNQFPAQSPAGALRACKTSKKFFKKMIFFIHLRAYFLKIFIYFPHPFTLFQQA